MEDAGLVLEVYGSRERDVSNKNQKQAAQIVN